MSQQGTLKAIFDKYAGKEIRHPDRLTRDIDPVMDALAQEIIQAGFRFGAPLEKDIAFGGSFAPPNMVSPEYERGADKKLRLTGKFTLGAG